ncbi:MAG: hypothetical protein WD691_01255 [Acidimicrobiales bacterium]
MRLRRAPEPTAVIDLREQEPVPPAAPQWGSPVPCPECAGRGYLDHIDPYKELMYLHCTSCGERFTVAKADLEADRPVDA